MRELCILTDEVYFELDEYRYISNESNHAESSTVTESIDRQ